MAYGTIVLLNGTVSAGKTSLARAVQRVMAEPYLHFGADMLGAICPPRFAGGVDAARGFAWRPVPDTDPPQIALVPGPYGHHLVEGLHRAIAALAMSGHNVVVDHILQEHRWRDDLLAAWRDLRVYLIGVCCPLITAEEREQARPDRINGVARWQFDRVHTAMPYDLTIDTSAITPLDGAAAVAHLLRHGPPPTAFHTLATGIDDT